MIPIACHVCGCTEQDCRQCIAKTGAPCRWIYYGLCSACATSFEQVAAHCQSAAARAGCDLTRVLEVLRAGIAARMMSEADAIEAIEFAHHAASLRLTEPEGRSLMYGLADKHRAPRRVS